MTILSLSGESLDELIQERVLLWGSESLFLPTKGNFGWSTLRENSEDVLPEIFSSVPLVSVLDEISLANLRGGWEDVPFLQDGNQLDEVSWFNLEAFGREDDNRPFLSPQPMVLTWVNQETGDSFRMDVTDESLLQLQSSYLSLTIFLIYVGEHGVSGIPKLLRSSQDFAFDQKLQVWIMGKNMKEGSPDKIPRGYYYVYAGH